MADRREYEMLFKLNAMLGGNYNSSFNAAQKKVSEMEKELQALNKRQGDISAYQKQQKAVADTKSKLELLQKQYDNIQKEISQTEGYSADLQNRLLQKQMQIEKTTSSVNAYESKLRTMDDALKQAGVDTGNLANENAKLSGQYQEVKTKQEAVAQEMQEGGNQASIFGNETVTAIAAVQNALAAAGLVKLFQETTEAIKECAVSSINFESGMTGIAKTSNLTEDELAAMGESVKDLSTEIPATTDELTQIGETAGQLGIADDNLLNFTTIMAELGTATTMTADNAATLLAQFANITQMDPQYYSNLGSAIVDLGNNFATTELKITELSQGIAASASLAGMSEADMVGLSAAVTSLGIESEMGATSISKLISDIMTAVGTGENLDEFARIANMSAEQFKQAWGTDAAGALTSFITGLSDTTRLGNSAIVTLTDLGVTETRMQRTILSLSNSGDLLTRAIGTANNAWDANTALATEAEKRYSTTASKLTMLENAYNNLKIAVGDNYTPALKEVSDIGTDILSDLAEFTEQHPVVVAALTSLTVGTVGFGVALTGLSAAATIAQKAFVALSAALKDNPWVWAVSGAIAAVGALVTLSATTAGARDEYESLSYASREQYDELQQLQAQYKEVCDAQGETSVEAQELKYNIDELTASYEDNKRSAEEVAEAQKAVIDSYQEHLSTYQDTIAGIDNESTSTMSLIARLQELVGAEGKTAIAKQEILTLVQMLNEQLPELGLNYDQYSDSLNMTAEQLKAVIQAELTREEQAANYEAAKGYYKDAQDAEAEWKAAIDDTAAAEKELQDIQSKGGGSSRRGAAQYASELGKAKAAVEDCKEAEEEQERIHDDALANYNALIAKLAGYSEGSVDASDATVQLNSSVANITSQVSALASAYEESYNKAYDSISGQMGLFEPMKVEVQTSVDEMIAALDSQVTYMESYSENIQKAQGMGLNDELLNQLSDGSVESAAYLQAIVDAGQSKVDALNAAYEDVEKGKQEFSDSVAEMETDFSAKMGQIQSDFKATVGDMDLSADAKESAINTIDSFIQGLNLTIPDALTKVQNFSNDIKSALGGSFTITASGTVGEIEHNARGTANAADVFLAGEEGPELVVGKGGSAVYTAEETKAMTAAANEYLQVMALLPQPMSYLPGAQTSASVEALPSSIEGTAVNLNVAYNIAAGTAGDSEALQTVLERNNENLREIIRETLEDIELDKRRKSF